MSTDREGQVPNRTVEVLIVEDALDHALLLTAILRSAGHYDVTHAQDGDRAIALLDSRDFDLVITDLNLPGTDGFDILRHIRDQKLGVPVFAVTGYTDPEFSQEASRAGAAVVLHKPLNRGEVLAWAKDVLPDTLFAPPGASG